MAAEGQCDGVEVWLVCLVSGCLVNVVQDDLIWSTSHDRVDFTQDTFVLTSYSSGIWCHQVQDSVEEAQSEAAPELQRSPGVRRTGGRLLTSSCSPGMQSPSSHTSLTETETELLMDALPKQVVLPASAGTAKERVCPVCDQSQYSSLALIWHLCFKHPDSRSYPCDICGSALNTTKALSCHRSLVHRDPLVSCHFCQYKATSHVRMHRHVCTHSKGEHCQLCKKSFPSVKALSRHTALHGARTQHVCDTCDSVFSMPHSLAMHTHGKHGEGYLCQKCGARFNSPAQHICHQKKCSL